jgi:F-type H+-transporting ATPase subunit b
MVRVEVALMIARLSFLIALAAILLGASCATAQEPSKSKASAPAAAAEKGEVPHGKAESGAAGEDHGAKGEKGHAEEHDDPYDNSHKNASYSLTNPSAFQADAAIFTFVIFLLLLGILVKFAWGPISRGLEAREKGIAEKIEQARIAAEQATAQLQQYEAKLAAATAEAQQIVAQARQDAEAAGQKLITEAQAASAKERERAVADIGAAKNQALQEIAERSVDTAVTLARNIIRREVRPADHEQLIQDALKQFPSAGNVN